MNRSFGEIQTEASAAAIQLCRAGFGQGSEKTPVFLHFSDVHNDTRRLGRIMQYYNANRRWITDIVHTGDLVASRFSDGISAVHDAGAENVLNVIGNHDSLHAKEGWDFTQITPKPALYRQFFEPFKDIWQIRIDRDTTYWYKDYSPYSIRLIGLDSTLKSDSEQVNWLERVLCQALDQGLSVMIAVHYPPDNAAIIPCRFSSNIRRPAYRGECTCLSESIQRVVEEFIHSGGEFICYLSGHVHTDFIWYNAHFKNQLFVTVDSSSPFQANHYSDTYRVEGTASEDLFNLFSCDTKRKLIRIVRVGANVNSLMVYKNAICINYKTMQIVSES